jgi:RNA-directed DNA polymerase
MAGERRPWSTQLLKQGHQCWEEPGDKAKPCTLAKHAVWRGEQSGKANPGAAGGDAGSLTDCEGHLKNTLEKLGNRMASGRYLPPPVRAVGLPQKTGGTSSLGMPTVGARRAQRVATEDLEPWVAPQFHPDSSGYRPGKAALQAGEVTRKRCGRDDGLVEYDSHNLVDPLDHPLMLRAVTYHTDWQWVLLYSQRWLTAPRQMEDGSWGAPTAGTPQGGVVRPLVAHLCLHEGLDTWMGRTLPQHPGARYADDGGGHGRTEAEAAHLLAALGERFKTGGVGLHPDQTRIISGQEDDRRGTYPETRFDCLGYTVRPRRAKNRSGTCCVPFTPGVSNAAATARRQPSHDWRLPLQPDTALADLCRLGHPVLRGWINYEGRV